MTSSARRHRHGGQGGAPRHQGPLACSGCGAALALPAALTAQEIVCSFCSVRTPIPPDLLAVRLREHEELVAEGKEVAVTAEVRETSRKASSVVMWVVLLSTLGPILLALTVVGVVAWASHSATHHAPTRPSHVH